MANITKLFIILSPRFQNFLIQIKIRLTCTVPQFTCVSNRTSLPLTLFLWTGFTSRQPTHLLLELRHRQENVSQLRFSGTESNLSIAKSYLYCTQLLVVFTDSRRHWDTPSSANQTHPSRLSTSPTFVTLFASFDAPCNFSGLQLQCTDTLFSGLKCRLERTNSCGNKSTIR